MIKGLAALILLTTLSLLQAAEVPQQIPLSVVALGDTITLNCPISGRESWFIFWYKMSFGYMVQTVARGNHHKVDLEEQFVNSRFTVARAGDVHTLTVTNISKDDEATYFCQAGEPYFLNFNSGTILAVQDHKNQQKHVYVKQSPETASVEPGHATTFQCSLLSKHSGNSVQCPGAHSVHWFRAGPGHSHPGIIYTQSRSDEQEKKSCVYSLSKTIHNSSDAGTYYCAVVTCGEILFGEGTKVEMRQDLYPYVIALGTLMFCCIIVIVALILFRKKQPVCEQCKGAVTASCHDASADDEPNDVDGDAETTNYVALGFTSRNTTRWKNRNPPDDCIYSGIRNSVVQ